MEPITPLAACDSFEGASGIVCEGHEALDILLKSVLDWV